MRIQTGIHVTGGSQSLSLGLVALGLVAFEPVRFGLDWYELTHTEVATLSSKSPTGLTLRRGHRWERLMPWR